MYKPIEYYCINCGARTSGPGECVACSLRTEYQRGYDAGMRSRGIDFRLPRYEPPPIDIRSEYQKGYDAGSGRDLLGSAGDGVFTFTGG